MGVVPMMRAATLTRDSGDDGIATTPSPGCGIWEGVMDFQPSGSAPH